MHLGEVHATYEILPCPEFRFFPKYIPFLGVIIKDYITSGYWLRNSIAISMKYEHFHFGVAGYRIEKTKTTDGLERIHRSQLFVDAGSLAKQAPDYCEISRNKSSFAVNA